MNGIKAVLICGIRSLRSPRVVMANQFGKVCFSTLSSLKESITNILGKQYCHRAGNNGTCRKFQVSVEGNIGSGKTELLEFFKNNPNVEIMSEPVDKWRNIEGDNALAHLYENPSRWSLALQTYVQLTMLQSHQKPQVKPVKLMERSIFSAKYCFVDNLHSRGQMTEMEYNILTKWFDWIIDNNFIHLDLIVYLRTDPETAHQRIRQRCRAEEQSIPFEYLKSLHDLHEDWLINQTKHSLPAPVLVLDGNKDLSEMFETYEGQKQDILCGQG